MDDKKTKTGIRVGQRGTAVLTLRRKPAEAPKGIQAETAVSGSPRKKASLVLTTLSVPA